MGKTPLEVMLEIMEGEDNSLELRFKAAAAAAPYAHPESLEKRRIEAFLAARINKPRLVSGATTARR